MTVAILGAGKLGEALLSGLLRAGHEPGDLVVTARRPSVPPSCTSGTASQH